MKGGSVAKAAHLGYSTIEPIDPSGVKSLPLHKFAGPDLTEPAFRTIWSKGEAIVLDGLLPNFDIQWTPDYFIEKYGDEECYIVDCNENDPKKETAVSTVADFFALFGDYRQRETVYKLKVRL